MAQDPIHVTLSDEAAIEFVRGKVSSGEYASEADVVREGIDALKQVAEERERWEREVLLPAYERYKADPSTGVPIEEVQRRVEARRRERLNAG
jgi:Arc/MetJ-type ribon-helix-helix transcriptional regulator